MTSRLDLPFTSFLDLLGVALEAGQRAYARVAFDGVDPCDLEADERESARALFGAVDRIPPLARNVIAVVAGGRSGKTYLSALRGLHLALTADLSKLAPGERAFVVFVAPDMALAESELERQLVETVIEAALNDPKQAQWLLERKFRNHWGRTNQDSGAETAPRYSDDVLKAWVEKRTEQKQGQS